MVNLQQKNPTYYGQLTMSQLYIHNLTLSTLNSSYKVLDTHLSRPNLTCDTKVSLVRCDSHLYFATYHPNGRLVSIRNSACKYLTDSNKVGSVFLNYLNDMRGRICMYHMWIWK